MEKKITVKEFVDKYNSLETEEQEIYFNSIIYRKYAPVLEKKVVLQTLLNKSIIKNEYDVDYLDLFLSRINTTIAILLLYTNLDIKKNDQSEENAFDDYDLLKENGLFDKICECIGETEMTELGTINGLIIDTYLTQKHDPKYFISSNIARVSKIITPAVKSGLEQIANVLKDNENMDKVSNRIINIFDKLKK